MSLKTNRQEIIIGLSINKQINKLIYYVFCLVSYYYMYENVYEQKRIA